MNAAYLGLAAIISLAAFSSNARLLNTRCRGVFSFSEHRIQRERSCSSGTCRWSPSGADAASCCLSIATRALGCGHCSLRNPWAGLAQGRAGLQPIPCSPSASAYAAARCRYPRLLIKACDCDKPSLPFCLKLHFLLQVLIKGACAELLLPLLEYVYQEKMCCTSP